MKTAKYNITEMTHDMAESVHSIEEMCFSDPWSLESFAEALENSAMSFFVAEDETEKIIGYAGIFCAADESELLNIAVVPEARRSGIAASLLDRAFSVARKRGASKMYLEVRESNEPARALYKKHGFEDIGVRKNYYTKPKEDGIIMMSEIGCQF